MRHIIHLTRYIAAGFVGTSALPIVTLG
jgi:hypothetical protein